MRTPPSPSKKVPIVVGPTGVGKTEVSLRLAESLQAEIVSADSRQIYRYLDVGTAKPPKAARRLVAHHFIDTLDPDEEYNAGGFARDARAVIEEITERRRLPLVVGGSGLYIRALVDGFYDVEVGDRDVKERLQERARREGTPSLHAQLARIDPVSSARLHPNDTQRIVRALEVYSITGRPFSELAKRTNVPADFDAVFVGLNRERAELYARIDARVDVMLKEGLVEEVERLRKMGYGPELRALQTVGYQEVFRFLEGDLSERQMMSEIKKNSRRYAKRQLTWFRRDRRIEWFDLTRIRSAAAAAGQIESFLGSQGIKPPTR